MNFHLDHFIGDFIGRQQSLFHADLEAHRAELAAALDGRSVLVIGGAGTIGGSFVKAALRYGQPARLYVVDINENGLTELTRDLRSSTDLRVPDDYKTYPINFADPVFAKLFRREGPFDVVANFAAHKHVRSEKDVYSIEAMVDNNVLKAKDLLDLLLEFPPRHFFCVSTDKAANPVNIMGASKKLMEEVIMAYAQHIPITTARFANVAFSNGSLPFGFLERLAKRQPFSAPSDVRRFFVSPAESGEICLLAALLGRSGEIFFPKLDAEKDMKTFTEIADQLLATHGFQPDHCDTEAEARQKAAALRPDSKHYPVHYFTSDTSGEKPYEEFFTDAETVDTARFRALGVIAPRAERGMDELTEILSELKQTFAHENVQKADVVAALRHLLPNFEHLETGRHLDQKM